MNFWTCKWKTLHLRAKLKVRSSLERERAISKGMQQCLMISLMRYMIMSKIIVSQVRIFFSLLLERVFNTNLDRAWTKRWHFTVEMQSRLLRRKSPTIPTGTCLPQTQLRNVEWARPHYLWGIRTPRPLPYTTIQSLKTTRLSLRSATV